MGVHMLDNPGPHSTATRQVGPAPVTTTVWLWDGDDHVSLSYDDLDVLDETIGLFLEARSNHLIAVMDGRSEYVRYDQLEAGDLAVIHEELVLIHATVLKSTTMIVQFCRKYRGTYDGSAGAILALPEVSRAQSVKRLKADVPLAVVR